MYGTPERKGNTMPETRTTIKWTPYLATAYAGGFNEGEYASDAEKLEAWAYLIKNGQCWTLQGFFGRVADSLINQGYVSRDGTINWDLFDYDRGQLVI